MCFSEKCHRAVSLGNERDLGCAYVQKSRRQPEVVTAIKRYSPFHEEETTAFGGAETRLFNLGAKV